MVQFKGKPAHFIRLRVPPHLNVDYFFVCSNHTDCPIYRNCGLKLVSFTETLLQLIEG